MNCIDNSPIKSALIDLVSEHNCLYYTKNANYLNCEYKNQLWETIAQALNACHGTDLVGKDIKIEFVS